MRGRCQIVGQLGYGASLTVWLARDLSGRRDVVLKMFITSASLGSHLDDEIEIYKHLKESSAKHPGRDAVRSLRDAFDIEAYDGHHRCLVHEPLWENALAFFRRNPIGRLPAAVLAILLRRLFSALDFLHNESQVIYTDIKADNIMYGIEDDSVLETFEEQELTDPSSRKVLDDLIIYVSRDLKPPKVWGAPVLCDFGSAMLGDVPHTEDIQPDIYRAPGIALEIPSPYETDIWNAGCMIWDLFEGEHLFTGRDPEVEQYRGRAHVAEMIALLELPPADLLSTGKFSQNFFTEAGAFREEVPLPDALPLERKETTLSDSEDGELFLQLMQKMLQWDPAKRSSAKALVEDEWIRRYT